MQLNKFIKFLGFCQMLNRYAVMELLIKIQIIIIYMLNRYAVNDIIAIYILQNLIAYGEWKGLIFDTFTIME